MRPCTTTSLIARIAAAILVTLAVGCGGGSSDSGSTAIPTVNAVSPNAGPLGGGEQVTITGSGLSGVTSIRFGTVAATGVTILSDFTVTAIAPAETAGTVNVFAISRGLQSLPNTSARFTYQSSANPVPTVTAVSPNTGAVTGGEVVAITGSGFSALNPQVFFGTKLATNVAIAGDNLLSATVPAGTGAVDVRVVTINGESLINSPADTFTYGLTSGNTYHLAFSFGSGGASAFVFDSSGNLVVSDVTNHRIQTYSATGTLLSQFTDTAVTGDNGAIAFAADGSLLLSKTTGILKYLNSSSSSVLIAAGGTSPLGNPGGIARDSSGNLYVVDVSGDRIAKLSATGQFIAAYGAVGTGIAQFQTPNRIAIDSKNNFYVTDTLNNRVEKFDSSGSFVRQFGTLGTGNGQFSKPNDIAVDASDNVYVTDSATLRVQKFDSNGAYIASIGLGTLTGTGCIAVAAKGNVYVNDSNRIAVFAPGT